MIDYQQWALDWCNYNGWATSDNNVKSSVIWIVSEGSNATWNPLDTTQPGQPGDSDYNSAGVKNYISLASGLEASRQTVTNGYYSSIIACYQRSASPAETCNAICNTPWGSQPTPTLVASVLSNYAHYALTPIAGSQGTVNPPTPTPIPKEPPSMFYTDPVTGRAVATDKDGNIYARADTIPHVVTLGQHPEWGAGNWLNPCVGIISEKDASGTWGYTFFTTPANGKGGFGIYNTYHINRDGTF